MGNSCCRPQPKQPQTDVELTQPLIYNKQEFLLYNIVKDPKIRVSDMIHISYESNKFIVSYSLQHPNNLKLKTICTLYTREQIIEYIIRSVKTMKTRTSQIHFEIAALPLPVLYVTGEDSLNKIQDELNLWLSLTMEASAPFLIADEPMKI